MTPFVVGLVLLAALMHAVWNALVKVSGDRLAVMVGMSAVGGVAGLAVLPFAVAPALASWPFLALTTAIHVGYYLFLLRAYAVGDLSQVYPVARGGSPLMLALISGPVMGEALSVTQAMGVGLISLGIISLSLGRGSRLALLYALCTACFIAAYSATDALGVRRSGSPLGYIGWLFLLDGAMMLAFGFWRRGRTLFSPSRIDWRQWIGGGVLALCAYGIVVWCYNLGTVAPVSALRETSVVFAALIGSLFLGEEFGVRRVIAAAVVASGIVVVNL